MSQKEQEHSIDIIHLSDLDFIFSFIRIFDLNKTLLTGRKTKQRNFREKILFFEGDTLYFKRNGILILSLKSTILIWTRERRSWLDG